MSTCDSLQDCGETSEEVLYPYAPGYPYGMGLFVRSARPIDLFTVVNGSGIQWEALERHGFLVLENTQPIDPNDYELWDANEPKRFIPPHRDLDAPFTISRLWSPERQRPYPTTFTTASAFHEVLRQDNTSLFNHWKSLWKDYLELHVNGFSEEARLLRAQVRAWLSQCCVYEHDWTKYPHSAVLFSNLGDLLHGRIIPEGQISVSPERLGMVVNWFYGR